MGTPEANRRTFLRLGVAATAVAGTGELLPLIENEFGKIVTKATGYQTDNAGARELVEERCADSASVQECHQNVRFPTHARIEATTVVPIYEEAFFRSLPSAGLSAAVNRDSPIRDAIFGTGDLGVTKGELLVGAGTTVMFAAAHNVTKKGFDTKTIPAEVSLFGMVIWYIQRKFGIVASTVGHAWFNFKVMR